MKTTALWKPDFDLTAFEPYRIDCRNCSGLCCVALYFSKIEGFPQNKDAGVPCRQLLPDYRCRIHTELSRRGLKGCMAYDCFGAGQLVTRHLKPLPDWDLLLPAKKEEIFQAYLAVMQLHQVLWYLTVSSAILLPKSEDRLLDGLLSEGASMTGRPLEQLSGLDKDIEDFRSRANQLIKKISRMTADKFPSPGQSITGGNFMGKSMKGKNLAGHDFTMALMIAADLEGAELTGANFLGADMRDTNVKNTNLSQCLYLTQIQINSAKGNRHTRLPAYLYMPDTWKLETS